MTFGRVNLYFFENSTASYSGNVVTIVPSKPDLERLCFYAPSDFSENDTYIINGLPYQLSGLNRKKVLNAWKQGSPISVVIVGYVAYIQMIGEGSEIIPLTYSRLRTVELDAVKTSSNEDVWVTELAN